MMDMMDPFGDFDEDWDEEDEIMADDWDMIRDVDRRRRNGDGNFHGHGGPLPLPDFNRHGGPMMGHRGPMMPPQIHTHPDMHPAVPSDLG